MVVGKVVGKMWAGDGVSRGEHEGKICGRKKKECCPWEDSQGHHPVITQQKLLTMLCFLRRRCAVGGIITLPSASSLSPFSRHHEIDDLRVVT